MDEWMLGHELERAMVERGCPAPSAGRLTLLVRLLVRYPDLLDPAGREGGDLAGIVRRLSGDAEAQHFLGVNRYRDTLWFVRESFEDLVHGEHLATRLCILWGPQGKPGDAEYRLAGARALADDLLQAGKRSGWKVDNLLREAGLSDED